MLGKLDVRGPDFMGHDITWTDGDGEGFRLEIKMADRPASEPHRQRWSYTFDDHNWTPPSGDDLSVQRIFSGDDFESPIVFSDDAGYVVQELLGFLSLNDGDTDKEYFDSYSERQIAWRDERAETLSMYVMEDDETTEYDVQQTDGLADYQEYGGE